jgi:AcrR family transcriptional regulator
MTVVTIRKSRRDQKKDATWKHLLATGIRLISANGIENITVDQIAQAADIGKGTVYNYFAT